MINAKEVQNITKQNSDILRLTTKCLDSIEKDILKAAKEGKYSVLCTLPNSVRGKNYLSELLEAVRTEISLAGYVTTVNTHSEVYVSWENTNTDTNNNTDTSPDDCKDKCSDPRTTKELKDLKDLLKQNPYIRDLELNGLPKSLEKILHISKEDQEKLNKFFKF